MIYNTAYANTGHVAKTQLVSLVHDLMISFDKNIQFDLININGFCKDL